MGKVLLGKLQFELYEPSGTYHVPLDDGENEAATDRVRVDFTEIEGTDFFRIDVFAHGPNCCGQNREYKIWSERGRAPWEPGIHMQPNALGATFWNVPGSVQHELHVYVGE